MLPFESIFVGDHQVNDEKGASKCSDDRDLEARLSMG